MSQFDISFEDFELIPGAELSSEDEQCLIDTLEVALYKLDQIKTSKRETKNYCNKNFHSSPGLKDGPFSHDDVFFIRDSEHSHEGNYYLDLSLNGKIFLYALYSLVKKEKYRFGYVFNYLGKELSVRHIISEQPEYVTDSATKFANIFDCKDIASFVRDRTREDLTAEDRFMAANSYLTDCKGWNKSHLSASEIENLYNPVCLTIELLVQEAEKELALSDNSKSSNNDAPDEQEDIDSTISEIPFDPESCLSEEDEEVVVFYNPAILGMDYYEDLDMTLNPDYATSLEQNRYFFQQWLNGSFRNSYTYDASFNEMRSNYSVIGKVIYKTQMSYQNYLKRLDKGRLSLDYLHKEDCIARWLKVTLECIDEAYDSYEVLNSDETDENGKQYLADTLWLRNQLIRHVFDALLKYSGEFYRSLNGEWDCIINYNFWPSTFRETYDKYHGQVGLTPRIRAVVYMQPNREFFAEWLNKACDIFVRRANDDDEDYFDLCDNMDDSLTKKLSDLFSDFVERFNLLTPSEGSRADAGLFWIFNTIGIIYEQHERRSKRIINTGMNCNYSARNDEEFIDCFFLDCLRILSRTLSNFVEDNRLVHSGELSFSPWRPAGSAKAYDPDDPDVDCFIEPEVEESPSDGAEDTVGKPESTDKKRYPARGMATINVAVIYNHVASLIKTSLKPEDFSNAIVYADFSALREDGIKHRAKEYPQVIICKLKDLFDDDWYYACCQSLKMEPTKVSGYHREGRILTLSNNFPGNLTMK